MKARIQEGFDSGWLFFLGHAPGAHKLDFDDSTWRRLSLPHDFSIEREFDAADPGGADGGYLPSGLAWYRKRFSISEAWRGKRVIIEFDGVYMNASVWINGRKLGTHHYGYTSFHFDLSPHLRLGKLANVVAVRVDNTKRPNSRWYSGAGIYRRVRLTITERIHIAHWGVAVSTPSVTRKCAQVMIESELVNGTEADAELTLASTIRTPSGKKAAAVETSLKIPALTSARVAQRLMLKKPELWDINSPRLYLARVAMSSKGRRLDDLPVKFGVRSFRFDPAEGFVMNGRRLKLKGVNLHHDNGCLGSAVYRRAEERRVELMKSIGANAIRTSHNPPSPEFLDACDRLGLVVIEEAFDEWESGKLKYGYKDYFKKCWRKDISNMVLRDRNHPSILLWSIGNEVPEQGLMSGAKTARKLAGLIRKLDPSRPVTYGASPEPWTRQLWEALDVRGYNYRDDLYAVDRAAPPKQCIIGTETFPLFAFETWTRTLENRNVGGEFIWTGMDYIGESGIGHARDSHSRFPVNTACCGELDICGFKKTRSYYRDILWGNHTLLHIAVRRPLAQGEPFRLSPWGWPEAKSSWTWPEAEGVHHGRNPRALHVDVYSACDEVELRLNGESLGRRSVSKATCYIATWLVPYKRGVLEAIGYEGGRKAASRVLRTALEPERIRLTPDRRTILAGEDDLSFVTVEALDSSGQPHPNAANEIVFSLTGPGELVGVANGNQASLEPFKANRRKLHDGRCLAVIKSTSRSGRILLKASSKGLVTARSELFAR